MINMKKYIPLLLLFYGLLPWQNELKAQFLLEGEVIDETGEGVILANIAVYKNGNLLTGTQTDFDGFFQLNLPDSLVILEISYTGYKSKKMKLDGKRHTIEVILDEKEMPKNVIISCQHIRLIDRYDSTQGQTITAKDIKNLPTRNIHDLAKTSQEPASKDGGNKISMHSGRAEDILSIPSSSISAGLVEIVV